VEPIWLSSQAPAPGTTVQVSGWTLSPSTARGEDRRGEQEGEQGLARGVPPTRCRRASWRMVSRRARDIQPGAEVVARCRFATLAARRSMPPRCRSPADSPALQGSRGVSDHPKWPLGLPTLRPQTWSLTPRLRGVGGWCRRRSVRMRENFDAKSSDLRDFSTGSLHWLSGSDVKRLTPRG
jgi:hypothetical protein